MTNKEKLIKFLTENNHNYCDDCLAKILNISRRQTVNQICNGNNVFTTNTNLPCTYCGNTKKTRSLQRQATSIIEKTNEKKTKTSNNSRYETLVSNIKKYFTEKLNLELKEDLTVEKLFGLKTVLSNVNNMLTYKTTLAFVNWLSEKMNFSCEQASSIIQQIEYTSSNANGFDVYIKSPIKIIAEVKCNIPINNSESFGAKQREGIFHDIEKLMNDKSDSIKFMVLLENQKVKKAFNENSFKNKLKQQKEEIILVDNSTNFSKTNAIYIVFVKI